MLHTPQAVLSEFLGQFGGLLPGAVISPGIMGLDICGAGLFSVSLLLYGTVRY